MTAVTVEAHQRLVTLKVRRYDPESGGDAYWQAFEVPVEQGDRLLDTLHHVTEEMVRSGAWNPEAVEPKRGEAIMNFHGYRK